MPCLRVMASFDRIPGGSYETTACIRKCKLRVVCIYEKSYPSQTPMDEPRSKRKKGRPKKEGSVADKPLPVRFTAEERAGLKADAEALGWMQGSLLKLAWEVLRPQFPFILYVAALHEVSALIERRLGAQIGTSTGVTAKAIVCRLKITESTIDAFLRSRKTDPKKTEFMVKWLRALNEPLPFQRLDPMKWEVLAMAADLKELHLYKDHRTLIRAFLGIWLDRAKIGYRRLPLLIRIAQRYRREGKLTEADFQKLPKDPRDLLEKLRIIRHKASGKRFPLVRFTREDLLKKDYPLNPRRPEGPAVYRKQNGEWIVMYGLDKFWEEFRQKKT